MSTMLICSTYVYIGTKQTNRRPHHITHTHTHDIHTYMPKKNIVEDEVVNFSPLSSGFKEQELRVPSGQQKQLLLS